MIYRFKGAKYALIFVFLTIFASCGGDNSTGPGVFDVYGRLTWRPFEVGLPFGEFFLFHNGEPISGATIAVDSVNIPAILSESGHYYKEMNFHIGDTL
jgi:hypothetical protein